MSYCCIDGNILWIYNSRLYNVEFSFVKVCIHLSGGPCIWFFFCPVPGHSLEYLRHPRRPFSGLMRGQFEVCVVGISMFWSCVRLQATLRESQVS